MPYAPEERARLARIYASDKLSHDVVQDKPILDAAREFVDATLRLAEMCGVDAERIAAITTPGELDALHSECVLEATVLEAASSMRRLRAIEAEG